MRESASGFETSSCLLEVLDRIASTPAPCGGHARRGNSLGCCMRIQSTDRSESDQSAHGRRPSKRVPWAPRQRGAEVGGESDPSAQCAQVFLGVDVEVDTVARDGHLVDTLGVGFEQATRTPVAPERAQLSLV